MKQRPFFLIFTTFAGILILCFFAFVQRHIIGLGFTTDPKAFVVPVFYGGFIGFFFGMRQLHIWRDRVQLQQLNNELIRQKEEYRTVADFTYDWEYWLSPDGTLRYISPSCLLHTGYSAEEFKNNPDLMAHITLKDDFKQLAKHLPDDFDPHKPSQYRHQLDFRITTKFGDHRWFAHACQAVFNENGQYLGQRATNRDITDRKQAEAEAIRLQNKLHEHNDELLATEEMLRVQIEEYEETQKELKLAKEAAEAAIITKSQFLSIMSHEIRTPMNGVVGMAHLLKTTELDDEQNEYVSNIQLSIERLTSIVNDILDVAKIEAQKMVLNEEPFVFQQAVSTVISMMKPVAEKKNIDIAINISSALPSVLIGDAIRLQQILTNLMDNAIKFTSSGSIYVTVETVDENERHITLKIQVSDTGIGISPEAQKYIFEPFTQADSGTTRKYGGTGLGLTICNRLVALMGGQIGVVSNGTSGATFWFTVVLERFEYAK